jgi:hypothetical protein
LALRIGVHAGPAIVGNFGGGRLFDYTAYGDTICRRWASADASVRTGRADVAQTLHADPYSGPSHCFAESGTSNSAVG